VRTIGGYRKIPAAKRKNTSTFYIKDLRNIFASHAQMPYGGVYSMDITLREENFQFLIAICVKVADLTRVVAIEPTLMRKNSHLIVVV
jgi:hypothetical protein